MYCWAGEPYSEQDCECRCSHINELGGKEDDLGFCDKCMHKVDIVTSEQYAKILLSSILEYDKERVKKCVRLKYYVQAIDDIHIQIYDELKFLLIKKIKRLAQIPIDEKDPRFKLVINIFERAEGKELFGLSFIFENIDVKQYYVLMKLNAMRNTFSHTFKERARYQNHEIINTIKKAMDIEGLLENDVNQAKMTGEF